MAAQKSEVFCLRRAKGGGDNRAFFILEKLRNKY